MFSGKKITVMGLGLLGRGVGDTKYLAQQGAELLVTDLKSAEELKTSLDQLKEFSSITYVLGEHRLEDFENVDMVLKGNGVPLDNKYINHARENGVEIVMSGALFHELSGLKMIGITGTRGKTTVTHLVHHAIENSLLGGNVRGVSNLELLNQTEGKDVAVFELDSWQLQGFGDRKISPNIAVFTNFMEDHLNYYKGDMDLYFKDKANIFLHQKEGDVLIIGEEMEERIKEYRDDYIVAKRRDVDPAWHPNLIGEHNEKNAACAYHVLKTYGLGDEQIKEAFMSFRGIEGRLEDIGEVNGVEVFNDSTSTTPAATVAGINALKGRGKLIVIAGGSDKDLSLDGFNEALDSADHVMLLAGSGTEKLERGKKQHESLQDAVNEAFEKAEEGDVILFSPGFASFGMFANEYDRNDQFLECIKRARLT